MLDIQIALRSIKKKCFASRKNRSHAIKPVMACIDKTEERLDASTAFTNVGNDFFWTFHCEDWARERKMMVLSVQMSHYEIGENRNGTHVAHRF